MIYLVHHGDAVGPDIDPMRPLSEKGRVRTLLLADKAARNGAKPAAIWHSGKRRARQTAEAFWKVCHPFAELRAERGLQPADPPEWIRDRLIGESRDLMIVGHMPHLARLLRLMTTGTEEGTEVTFPLHGIVALEQAGDRWQEMWRAGS